MATEYRYTKTRFFQKNLVFVLSYLDSNQDKQNQNLLCYHYTIGQSSVLSVKKRCKGITLLRKRQIFVPLFVAMPCKTHWQLMLILHLLAFSSIARASLSMVVPFALAMVAYISFISFSSVSLSINSLLSGVAARLSLLNLSP